MSNGAWLDKRAALREHSVMRISTDIRNADTWDEAAISERGERLATLAMSVWSRPDDSDEESEPSRAELSDTGTPQLVGPPDPDNPDAFASPLAIADEVGVGVELRRIIEVSREIGLYPRPDRYSVMVSPPADRRIYLFTVWPQWTRADRSGSGSRLRHSRVGSLA